MPVQLAYLIRRWLLGVLRWPTRGAKVMAFDREGALLLIRNRYGQSDLWVLPGGGVGRREQPIAAAVRELRQETGCALREVIALGVYRSHAEGKRDTVHLFRGETEDVPEPDRLEVAEARFFRLDALPQATSAATRRRIDEVRGVTGISEVW